MQSIPRIEPVCTAAARLSRSDGLDQRRLARHRCFEYSGDVCPIADCRERRQWVQALTVSVGALVLA